MARKIRELPTEKDLDSIVNEFKELVEDESHMPTMWFLPTGNLALDYVISGRVDGTGGYPSCIVEIFGDPASGKSVMLAKAIAEAQRMGLITVLADAEARWDDEFAALHGVDANKLIKFYPETVEQFSISAVSMLDKLEESQRMLMIIDSWGILSTEKEMDDVESGDVKADQGRKAQKIKLAMRVLRKKVRKTGSIILGSNHVIDDPSSYSHKKKTPGGGGVPFQSSVRIELGNPTPLLLKGKDRPIGVEIHAKITKNSVAPPFGECSFNLYWARGISKYSGLLDVALDLGIITKSGAWNYFGEKSFQASDFEATLQEHPEILTDERWLKPYWME